jgi:oligopeptide transport system substrate-binding protein
MLAGGGSYLFRLRDDMHWNDGVPVTAGDFVYAWQRVLDPVTGSPNASYLFDIKGARAFHQGKFTDPDQVGVRALDALTLLVELESPTGHFPQPLTYWAFCPVPRHIVEVQGQAWVGKQPLVTNGPFQLVAWQQGQSMMLSRNPKYGGQFTGNVQRVELSLAVTSSAEQLALYEANHLDLIRLSPSPEADRIRHKRAEEYFSGPDLSTLYLGFNTREVPFNDLRVRQAFALALDKETLASVVLTGYNFSATGGIIPAGMPGHSPEIGLPYNPEQARQLLGEAGYPDGRNFPVLNFLASSGAAPSDVADYLQWQWNENLDIEIVGQILDHGPQIDQLRQGRFHLYLTRWSMDFPDPGNVLTVFAFRNFPRWQDETFNGLVEKARRMTSQAARTELYRQADKILVEEAPWVPVTYGEHHMLVKPWVSRFFMPAIDRSFWEEIVIEPHDETRQPRRTYEEIAVPRQRARAAQPATLPSASHVLRLAGTDWETLDPAVTGFWHMYDILFSGLVAESPEMEVEPEVAQSWEILAGGQKYIFHLQNDVRWSDGTPLTAADFEYAWKRVLDPATNAPYANLLYDIKNAGAFHQGDISDPDQVGVRALDDVTLAVELEQPAGYFLQLLTTDTTYPVPRHVLAACGEAWATPANIVTNGPFRIETWFHGEAAVLIRDANYRGRFTGNVERVELRLSSFDPAINLAL